MIVTVHRVERVSADIEATDIGRYLDRSGWALVQLGDFTDDVLPSFKLARWQRGGIRLTIRNDDEAGNLAVLIEQLATLERRQPADVLSDIAGHPLLERNRASVLRSSAMARRVDALEDHRRARGMVEQERARVRIVQAELEVERMTRAMRAAAVVDDAEPDTQPG